MVMIDDPQISGTIQRNDWSLQRKGIIDEDRIKQLKRYGITQVLRKPFRFEDLLAAIMESLPDGGA